MGEEQNSWRHHQHFKEACTGSFPTLATTTGKVAFKSCPQTIIAPCEPSASICCDFSRARQQRKKSSLSYLEESKAKSYCSTVPPALRVFINPWTILGVGGEKQKTLGKQLIRFWQGGPNICFKQKTSAYFTFIFHNLQKQPAKI